MMNALLPLYYQIKQTIKNWILNKEYGPGDKIPSENELAAQFNVNRLTVRQAISQLIQEGFLVSKRGQGTFVANNENILESLNLEFTGFMDDLFYQIAKTKTKSVEITKINVSKSLREKFKLDRRCEEVIEIKRVRFKRNNSFAYTVNYLPLEIGNRISEKALKRKPLLQIMEQDLGIQFTEAFQTIEASFADVEVAKKLGVSPGSPILYVERVMYAKNHKPVEFVQTSYRGDLYKYIVRLKTVKRKHDSIWVHDYK
jgi:GntR family transcriptional regulator